jgi:uroporphyrinogen decarboxylase
VIAVVDPMTSQIGPDQFRRFVQEPMTRLFARIREWGAAGSFFVCGHAQKNISVMCDCSPENVSIDENIPLDYVKDECLKRGISFGGNMRLTTVLLMGTPRDAAAHAADCMRVGGEVGFVLAPGCDLPYATPPENLQAVAEVAHDPYRRQVAQELASAAESAFESRFDMSGYGRSDKVIIDIITLDSESCAPCQYMVESVKQVAPQFEDLLIWREHKIKRREGVEFMMALMVRNVPTICIDGQIRFVSVIPPRDELIQAIQDRINEKLRMKIRRRQVRVTVVGAGSEVCEQTAKNVRQAIEELGAPVEFEQVEDESLLRTFGARQTPAVIISRSQLKSAGAAPEVKIVKEWLKDL